MSTEVVSTSPLLAPSPSESAVPSGSLQERKVEDLKTEISQLEKQLKRRNTYVAVASLICLVAGVALLATGMAIGCLPLAFSSMPLIVIAVLIPSIAGNKHIHPDVSKAIENQEFVRFIAEQEIPLHRGTLLKSYEIYLEKQRVSTEIQQHLLASAEDMDPALREFAEEHGLAISSNNRAQALALFQSKKETERQVAELRLMEESPEGSSELIKVTYPQF